MFLAYPYTDLYNLNLDWMIKAIKEVQEVIENLGSVVNTFNEREGDVVLTASDVNNLQIDSVVTLPEGSFDTLTEAQKTAYYEAGKRILVALDAMGEYSKLGFLYKAGASIGMAEYYPTPAEYAVLSFNGRTGQVTLNTNDVNNLDIQPVLQIYGADISTLTNEQKLQYFDAGIRFIQCIPTQSGTLTTQKLYNLRVQENGDIRTPVVVAYDPLQGQSLVKAVNQSSPNNAGQLYLYADGIDMANDDNDTVYSRITTLEGAAVKSVNGVQPTQGDVVVTGSSIQVASDDDTTIDDFAVYVYQKLDEKVESVNGVLPTQGAVTVTGADIAVSANDATKIDAALELCEKRIYDRNIEYIRGIFTVEDTAASPYTTYQILTALWSAITPITYAINFDIQVRSSHNTRRRLAWGFKTLSNSGSLYLQDVRKTTNEDFQTLYQLVSDGTNTSIAFTPKSTWLSYNEPEFISTDAYSAGDFISTPAGIVRAKTDLTAGTNLYTSSNTEKFANGILNALQYEELVLSATDFISGTITDTDFQMSLFRFGPLKLIMGRVTFVAFNSSLSYVDILNIPARFRGAKSESMLASTRINTPINISIAVTPTTLRVFKNPDVQSLTNFSIRFCNVYY